MIGKSYKPKSLFKLNILTVSITIVAIILFIFLKNTKLLFYGHKLIMNAIFEFTYFVFICYLLIILAALGKKIASYFKVKFNSILQEILISEGIGLGICMFVVLLVGLAHLLYLWLLVQLLVLINIFVFKEVREIIFELAASVKNIHFYWYETIILSILSIYIILYFLSSLVPINAWDPLTYYITVPSIYARQHAITNLLTHFNSNYPAGMEMIFTLLMIFFKGKTAGYIVCQIFTVFVMVLTCLSIYSLARRFFNRTFSLFSLLVFISMPFVISFNLLAKNDLGLMFYETVTVMSLVEWIYSKEKKWLITTAVLCAFVFSMKYLGFYTIAAVGTVILVRSVHIEKKVNINILKNIFLFSIIFLIFISPWIIKSYIYTRNPIFPMFQNIFHSPLFNNWLNAHLIPRPNLVNRHIIDCFTAVGKIIKDFWLPLIFIFAIFWIKKNTVIRYIIFYALVHYFIWAVQFAEAGPLDYLTVFRYLDGLFPIIVILIIYSIKELLPKKYLGKVIVTIFVISIIFNLPNLPKLFRKSKDNIVQLRKAGIYEEFGMKYGMAPLQESMIRYINDNLPQNAKVLSCYIPFTYYLERETFHAILNADTSRIFWDNDILNIYNKLGKLGIEYVIGLKNKIWPEGWAIENNGIFFKPENIDQHLNSIVNFDGEILYEIPKVNYKINSNMIKFINEYIPKEAKIGVLSFGSIKGNPLGIRREDLSFACLDARTPSALLDCDYVIINLNIKEKDKPFSQKVLEGSAPIYKIQKEVALYQITKDTNSLLLKVSTGCTDKNQDLKAMK